MGWTKPPQAATEAYADPVSNPTTNASVDAIDTDLPDAPETVFRPVYTALDEDVEVEIVKHVSAEHSPHQFGHVVAALSLDQGVRQHNEAQSHQDPNQRPDVAQRRSLDHEAVTGGEHEPPGDGVEDAQPPVANVPDEKKGKGSEPGGHGGHPGGEDDREDARFNHGNEGM